MALYIFSDAHLGSGSEELETRKVEQIRRLFERVRADGARLVILGDLFDFWFEYRHAIPKEHHQVLCLLSDLVDRGIAVDYVSGNHDFWMGDFFTSHVGVNLHQDHLNIEYEGKRLHLIHGDGLAPADRGYRLLKRILRNRYCIWFYRKLPPDWAIPLAKRVSVGSRQYTSRRDHAFAKDYEAYAARQIAAGYDAVAIGHLHIPICRTFERGTYINTGDFIHHFTYAKMTKGVIRLERVE